MAHFLVYHTLMKHKAEINIDRQKIHYYAFLYVYGQFVMFITP